MFASRTPLRNCCQPPAVKHCVSPSLHGLRLLYEALPMGLRRYIRVFLFALTRGFSHQFAADLATHIVPYVYGMRCFPFMQTKFAGLKRYLDSGIRKEVGRAVNNYLVAHFCSECSPVELHNTVEAQTTVFIAPYFEYVIDECYGETWLAYVVHAIQREMVAELRNKHCEAVYEVKVGMQGPNGDQTLRKVTPCIGECGLTSLDSSQLVKGPEACVMFVLSIKEADSMQTEESTPY